MDESLAKTLATIAQFAATQKARLQSVTVGDVSFTLTQDLSVSTAQPFKAPPPVAPMDDPTTYGLPEGSKLPGFTDPRRKADT